MSRGLVGPLEPARCPDVPHLGLQLPSFTFPDVPDDHLFERIGEIAVTAEAAGFDSF